MAIFDSFLKIDGVTDNLPGGQIELESFSWGVSNPTTVGTGTGGAGSGKASFQDFSITVRAGKQTTNLFEAAFKGTIIKNATLTVTDKAEPITIRFTDVVISNYKFDEGPSFGGGRESDGDRPLGAPMESVSFNFGQISVNVGGTSTSGGTGGTLGGGVF
jgi:type VI secretion system secreted protein Hcp